jgi:hypothetical protein
VAGRAGRSGSEMPVQIRDGVRVAPIYYSDSRLALWLGILAAVLWLLVLGEYLLLS